MLYCINEYSQKTIVWQNPKPSSTDYCRPIKVQFKKETSELASQEVSYIEGQISLLENTMVKVGEKEIAVSHNMVLTMIDGKICNALTKTSTQTCYICKATPKLMNNLEAVVAKEVDPSTFRFGLSSLHAWIRFFECLLHLAYRLEVKEWQIRGAEKKEIVAKRKLRIQKDLRRELGLIVDQPKPGGSGNTNDGNTARRFFGHEDEVSRITRIDKELIHRFGVVLKTISSGFEVNAVAFNQYARQTAQMFVNLYPWYYMPPSVHKILIHGSAIISAALLPIGQMSEEAQEARNKHLKQFRQHHSRKVSRQATNSDMFYRLLATSDPLISSKRNQFRVQSKKKHLPSDVINLLSPEPGLRAETSEAFSDSDASE